MTKFFKLELLVASFFFCAFGSFASPKFYNIDKHALACPDSVTRNIDQLVTYLSSNANSDREIVRSFYVWITNSIKYDYKAVERNRVKHVPADKILQKRITVCSGYSSLFKEMCDIVGIRAVIVSGYTRLYNFKAKYPFCWSEHAWNAVYLDNDWELIDVTWGRNRVSNRGLFHNEKYFLTDPLIMIFDHLPENKMWQLLNCPISLEDFTKDKDSIDELLIACDSSYDFRSDIYQYQNIDQTFALFKSSVDAYKFNPYNHFTPGIGHLNFGLYLSKINSTRYKRDLTKEQRILNQKEAISHIKYSKKLLKKSEYENAEKYFKRAKANLNTLKLKLKRIKK